jgi:hypothetical protein
MLLWGMLFMHVNRPMNTMTTTEQKNSLTLTD